MAANLLHNHRSGGGSSSSGSAVAAGTIVHSIGTTAPAGTLKMNGALVSRTTYAALWAFAQASGALVSEATWAASGWGGFGQGDGSTTFRLPDWRGEFMRNLDDGRGVDTSRVIGTKQDSQNLAHNHGVNDPGHAHALAGQYITNQGGGFANASGATSGSAGNNTNSSVTGISIQNSGGTEARPRNVAALACIKF